MKTSINLDQLLKTKQIKNADIDFIFGAEKLEGNYSFINCSFNRNVFIDEVSGSLEFINCIFYEGFSTGLLWITRDLSFINNRINKMCHLLCHVEGDTKIISNRFFDSFYLSDSVFEKELIVKDNLICRYSDIIEINSGKPGSAEALGYVELTGNRCDNN